MKKILIATKDLSPGNYASALEPYMAVLGWEQVILAEAASLSAWKREGITVKYAGNPNFNPNDPWRPNLSAIFDEEKPSLVVVGLSSPMNFERDVMAEAHRRGIPVVAIEDNWDACARSDVVADLYLVLDGLAERLIAKRPAYSRAKTFVMGDMAASEPDPKTASAIATFRRECGPVVIIGSGKRPETKMVFKKGLRALSQSRRRMNFVVIPSIHPGASAETKEMFIRYIKKFDEPLRGALVWLSDVPEHKWNVRDSLSKCADVTIALTGTGLRAAAHFRKMPVCVHTPEMVPQLQEETGGETLHPLTRLGAGLHLPWSFDLFDTIEKTRDVIRANQDAYLSPVVFDPEKTAKAVDSMFG